MSKIHTEDFNVLLKDKLNSYCKDYGYSEGLNNCNSPVIKGKCFLKFYLHEIFMKANDIDDEIIENGITDGTNDLGIDFININEDIVTIIQSKYGKTSVQKENLNSFITLPKIISNYNYIAKKGNNQLKGFIKDIQKIRNPRYQLIFIHDHKIDDKKIFEEMAERENNNTECSILDLHGLKEEYIRVCSIDEDAPEEVSIPLGNEDEFELTNIGGDYRTLIITLQGTKVKSIYDRYKETLFNYNIRLWLGKNAVNSSMIETIDEEPDRFFYYNNGVTAVCEKYSLSDSPNGKELRCTKFQIINGAQTITTIAKQNPDKLSTVKIMMRIIEAEKNKKTKSASGLNENIVRNNNNQTAITISDFRSNDLIQVFLAKELKKYSYNITSPIKDSIYYKRKRRNEREKSNTKVISMLDIGKAYYSFKYSPHKLSNSIKPLWDISPNGLYHDVFGDNGTQVNVFSPTRIEEMLASFVIYEYIKRKIKDLNKDENPCVFFKYHLLFSIGYIINKLHTDDEKKEIYSKIISGYYVNPKIDTPENITKFDAYLESAKKLIDLQIDILREDESQTFILRNFQRDRKFTERLVKSLNKETLPKLI